MIIIISPQNDHGVTVTIVATKSDDILKSLQIVELF